VRFGISSHIFAKWELCPSHIKKIYDAGFRKIELYVNQPHFPLEQEKKITEIIKEIKLLGLRVNSIHSAFYTHFSEALKGNFLSICSEQESQRLEAVDWIKKSLRIAEFINFNYLVVHFGGEEKEFKDIYFQQAEKSLRELLAYMGNERITIVLENITNAISSPKRIVQFLKECNLPNIGLCFDVGHSFIKNNIINSLDAAADYILECHIHDNFGHIDEHLIPFEGSINWPVFITKLREKKFNGCLVIESQGGNNPEVNLLKCATAAKKLEKISKDTSDIQ
jgi:sugar phosphate isomerase/epimerase